MRKNRLVDKLSSKRVSLRDIGVPTKDKLPCYTTPNLTIVFSCG